MPAHSGASLAQAKSAAPAIEIKKETPVNNMKRRKKEGYRMDRKLK